MQKAPDGQYEMVLENRQVLTIFFAVVILCGVFFGLGFTVGKNTVGYIAPVEASGIAGGKKSALAAASDAREHQPAPQLTYDKTLQQKESAAAVEPSAPAHQPPAAPAVSTPPAARPAAEPGVILQIAALSKKEDADALMALLNAKGFRANPSTAPTDKLIRVQLGPFATMKAAEEAKKALEGEGFKPIVKK